MDKSSPVSEKGILFVCLKRTRSLDPFIRNQIVMSNVTNKCDRKEKDMKNRKIGWKLLMMTAVSLIAITGPPETAHAETKHYDDQENVVNLTAIPNNTVDMVAQWSSPEIILPDAEKPGYTLEGWYKDPIGTHPIGKPGDPYTPTDPTETVYAKWVPNKYTVSFDTNLDHTETGRYTLVLPVGDTPDMEVEFDGPYGPLPVLIMDGYEFQGWYDKDVDGTKIDADKLFTNLTTDKTNGANQIVYAHWKNLNPIDVKLYATNGIYSKVVTDKSTSDVTMDWTNVPYTLYANAKDPGDGIGQADILRSDAYSSSAFDTLTYASVTELTKENATFKTYGTEGTTSVLLKVTDAEGQKPGRQLDGSTSTKKMNLKIDTKAPKATMTVSIGTHENPLNTVSNKSWNGWNVYNAKAYGAKINISISDENANAVGGSQDVSGIKHAWLVVSDTNVPDITQTFELVADGSKDVYTFSYDDIIDINNLFKGSMNLTYELHAVDNAGNEMPVVAKTTERKPEILTKVEKLTNDGSDDPLLFKAGYRGRLYIYTTGWVDTLSLKWPDCIVKTGVYDTEHGEMGMIYDATILTNGMRQDMDLSTDPAEKLLQQTILATELVDENNPSSKAIMLDADGEHTEFTRCYVFDFWVPVYIGYEDNPDHIDMNVINQINTKVTASKYLINSSAESITAESVTAMSGFDIRIGNGSIMEDFHTSIIN